uniref:Uncharacterized protein n=1 Tax=Fagus sylvatica TaxID=28930 RepID=A0A2N9IK69_FAGSY
MISKRQKEIYPALSLSKAAQTLPTPRRPAFHIPRPSRTEPRQFQPLPIPVPQLYTLLVKKKMITPVSQRTRIGPQPKDYNKDLTCEYHQGEVRHTVENCRVLRHRIQDLLDQGVLKFRIEGVINTIGAEKNDEVDIASTKIPWEPLFHELKKRGLLTVPRAPKESTEAGTCQCHPGARDHNLQGCEEFKKEVASLITKGLIRRRGEQPERDCMTIDQLRLSPYEKTNFQARMERIKEDFEEFCEKKKEELGKLTPATPLEISKPDPVVIHYATKEKVMLQTASVSAVQSSEKGSKRGDPSSATLPLPRQSGRCYTPEELEKRRKEAGKAVEDPTKTKATEEEAADFLRIIKSSEYSIVKQLSKMPSHISVLSLLLASESHRKALLKVLNEAYVPEDITGPSFENMVTSILVTNQLTFSDDELPPEGRGHTKALYISVKTNDRIVSRVLIDNGSALNVCPLSTLEKLDIDPTRVRVNSMIVRAFDGTRREVLGEIDLPVEVGPQVYNINFQNLYPFTTMAKFPTLMDVHPKRRHSYSFEFVTVIHRVAAVEPRLSRAGIMVAKEFVKAGFQPGQGLGYASQGRTAIVTLEGNKDGYGLGYTPTRRDRQLAYEARRQKAAAKLRGERWPEKKMVIPHIRTTFPASAMFQVDEGDVDELALLFTEDLSINAITAERDSAAPPAHPGQYEGIDLEDFLDKENLKGAFLERYRHNIKTPPSNNTTTTAEEEYAGPMVERLSIHAITAEEEEFHHHTTDPPLPTGKKKPRMWTCVPLLQRVSSSNETERSQDWNPLHHRAKGGTHCTVERVPRDLRLVLPRHARPRHRHSSPQDSFEARMQARQTSTAPNEARSHFEDQGGSGKAIEGRIPEHSNLFGLGSQHSPSAEKGRNECRVLIYGRILRVTIRSRWTEEDKSKTAFVTHWGTFVYDVMPFGLKNAGATYQRAMVTLFHDMIHHEIEVYVDDMIAKSRTAQDHLTDLRKLFQRLKKYQLRLNPNKCAFGVTSGKLLGFIVSGRGIEIDPAKLTATCEPLFKLLRKDVKIKWTEDCQRAFDKIKEYLLNPPILVPPTPGRPLILYLTVQEASMGCMLGQQDETGKKEQAIYYLSKKFTEPETRYLLVEKTCCALAWASKKLRQYMLYYTTWLVSRMDPIKYIFEKPALTGKIARWQSTKTIMADGSFTFDGAANAVGSGIGAVLVSPKGQQTPIAVKLGFDCTNNMTEYEACIVGLQAALEFGAYELEVFGDSLLIVSQTNGEWQARDPKLIPYQRYISRLVPKFKLETSRHTVCAWKECMNVEAEIDNKPWYYDIKRFIQDREYPPRATENEKKYIRRMAIPMQRKPNRLIQEMHAGLMGAHANGPFLARKIMRAGYYWLTMERDCIRHVQTCHKCQMYQNSKNAPPQYLHTMASPWPFSAWGMDVIGAITPKASNGHEFILVAIDYFTKWVEACSFKNVTQVAVTRFVKNNIICRYGMPEMLITDNASNLNNRMMDQLCQQFKIQHHNSAPYRPKMNGAVEAANKNVKKILSKMTETYKDWHEHLPYALCAYRTSVRTSVGATPYSLVYGMEAVLPVEVEIPSLRILSQTQLEEAEWAQARYEQLNFIDEKRLAALCHGQLYQRRIERAYNKKARPRTFQPGDLVLKKRNMALSDPRGKFAPSYEGPYVVKKAFSGGAIILADMDGEEFRSPINSDSVIKYHV